MAAHNKKISIFIDTNILQIIWGSKTIKNVHLDRIEITQQYYDLIDFIRDYNLEDVVEVCIPSIVAMEFKQHMYKHLFYCK